MRDFIKTNRADITAHIRKELKDPEAKLNDEDRYNWIMNDERLYRWAQAEGCKV